MNYNNNNHYYNNSNNNQQHHDWNFYNSNTNINMIPNEPLQEPVAFEGKK